MKFEFKIHKISSFIHMLENLMNHSDTAMIKIVKNKGLYILLTDFETMCSVETRYVHDSKVHVEGDEPRLSCKVLLDSLANVLRKIQKNKTNAILASSDPYVMQVYETNSNGSVLTTHAVTSTEHRPRLYYIISTKVFCQRSQNYCQFQINYSDLNRIINNQCIISGNLGGITTLTVSSAPSLSGVSGARGSAVHIKFHTKSGSGCQGGITIKSSSLCKTTPILHEPSESIHLTFMLTYLKRSQALLATPGYQCMMYVSNKGLIIQTDPREEPSTLITIISCDDVDPDSYC
jgi:hypothetical protein